MKQLTSLNKGRFTQECLKSIYHTEKSNGLAEAKFSKEYMSRKGPSKKITS